MKLDIVKMSKSWNGIKIRKKELEQALLSVDTGLRQHDTICVALSTDAHVQQLNRDFRGKDKPTNVLSFPNEHGGDVILAIETICREAETEGKTVQNHIEHLIVHGCLHVAGYDHEHDEDAEEMESLEISICSYLGFNPYENR